MDRSKSWLLAPFRHDSSHLCRGRNRTIGSLPAFESDFASKVFAEIRARVGETAYSTWFEGVELISRRGGGVELRAPSAFHRSYLSHRYSTLIADSVAAIQSSTPGEPWLERSAESLPEIEFTDRSGSARNAAATAGSATATQNLGPEPPMEATSRRHQYTFDRFIAGPANQFALAAARSVAEDPGGQYNPLFLHGTGGLGKTHLLQAIAGTLEEKGFQRVVSIGCTEFTDDFIAAVGRGNIESFRQRYRQADALLVDDIHFLEAKNKTQEEFFHTFNALSDLGRQIVLTSDTAPGEIPGLGERLISRFRKGLVATLTSPDQQTRIAIVLAKGKEQGLEIPIEVAELIAKRVRENVRELEGAILRLHSLVHLERRPLNLENTRQALIELFGEGNPRIDIVQIERGVLEEFDVTVTDLHSRRRNRSIVIPRQVCMYLARRLTNASLGEIGLYFGGRDHTTVLHAVQKIEGLRDADLSLRRRLDQIESSLLR